MSESFPPPSATGAAPGSATPATAPQGSAVGEAPSPSLPPPPRDADASPPPGTPRPRRSHRALLVVGVVALVLIIVGVVVAVASGTSDESYSLDAALDDASTATVAEFDMTITVGDEPPITMSAAVDGDNDVLGMEVSADAILGEAPGFGAAIPAIDVVFDGAEGVIYMRAGAFTDIVDLFGVEAEWIAFDLDALNALGDAAEGDVVDDWSEALGEAPFAALGELVDSDEVEEVGRETIDGVETQRYRVAVDGSDLLDGFPALGTMGQELEDLFGVPLDDAEDLDDLLGDTPAELGYDVWVTEDNQLRRISASVTVAGQSMTVTIDFLDIGGPIDVAVPSDDEVFDLSELLGG